MNHLIYLIGLFIGNVGMLEGFYTYREQHNARKLVVNMISVGNIRTFDLSISASEKPKPLILCSQHFEMKMSLSNGILSWNVSANLLKKKSFLGHSKRFCEYRNLKFGINDIDTHLKRSPWEGITNNEGFSFTDVITFKPQLTNWLSMERQIILRIRELGP